MGKYLKRGGKDGSSTHICFPGLPLNEIKFASFASSGLKCYLDFISLNKDSMPIEAFPPPYLCNELQTTEFSVGEIIIIILPYVCLHKLQIFSPVANVYLKKFVHPSIETPDCVQKVSQNHRITERLQLAGTSGSIQPNASSGRDTKSRVCRAMSRQLIKISKEDTPHPLWAACAHIKEAFTDVQREPPLFYLVPVACGTPWTQPGSILFETFLLMWWEVKYSNHRYEFEWSVVRTSNIIPDS